MKLSQLGTDKALDVLCELAPPINDIITDPEIVATIGKVVNPGEKLTKYGGYALIAGRIGEVIPLLLKTHRSDVYKILCILNDKSMDELAEQPVMETIRQIQEAFRDEELLSFFKSFEPQAQSGQSAPSAVSPA